MNMISAITDTLHSGQMVELVGPHCHGKTATAIRVVEKLLIAGECVCYHYITSDLHNRIHGPSSAFDVLSDLPFLMRPYVLSIDDIEQDSAKFIRDRIVVIDEIDFISSTLKVSRSSQIQDIRRRLKDIASREAKAMLILTRHPDPDDIADFTVTINRGEIFIDPQPTAAKVTIYQQGKIIDFGMLNIRAGLAYAE